MTKPIRKFLIVDDDPANNLIAGMLLRKSFGDINIKDFLIPETALEYIETECKQNGNSEKTVLLLDINMPTLSGWEFLDKFKTFNKSIQNQFDIYMVSSSVDPIDIERAKQNPLVIDFIEKPLSKTMLIAMFG